MRSMTEGSKINTMKQTRKPKNTHTRYIRKNKRGFSLAETVVALAVIMIVSLSATTLIATANKATQNALYKAQAQNFVYNAITVFRTDGNFSVLGIMPDENGVYLYQLGGGYTATIQIVGNTISITVTDNKGRTTLEEKYTKGGTDTP